MGVRGRGKSHCNEREREEERERERERESERANERRAGADYSQRVTAEDRAITQGSPRGVEKRN